jgi:hypothetical protein
MKYLRRKVGLGHHAARPAQDRRKKTLEVGHL